MMPKSSAVTDGPITRQLAIIAAVSLAVMAGLYTAARSTITYPLPIMFVHRQDGGLAIIQVTIVLLACCRWMPVQRHPRISARDIMALAGVVIVGCWAGHRWLLQGLDLSRDEQMANFDSWIYARGHLVWPLPRDWLADSDALNLLFIFPVTHPHAWVSAYLPGNSLLRCLFASIASADLTGPVLTGLSLPLLWGCARQFWPDDDEAVAISVLLLAVSGQFLITGMTAYAMPAHLFFNLLFLWLFLRDNRWCDLGAAMAGMLATGLHQPLFHFLFVTPFLLLLVRSMRWYRVAFFTGSYLLIGLFWLHWPQNLQGLVAGPNAVSQTGIDFLSRLQFVLRTNAGNGPLMACNLLRFFTWQHALVLPVLIAALRLELSDPHAQALLHGMLLTVLTMAVIIPMQGHGFGYRYLHGFLGNVALLGGYVWRALPQAQVRLRPWVVRVTVLGMLPLMAQMAAAYQFYAPYAQIDRKIAQAGTDYVVVSSESGPFAQDQVINRPDLSNRPLRLLADKIDNPTRLARRLCRPGTSVAIAQPRLFAPAAALFDETPATVASARLVEQARIFAAAGCQITRLE